MGGPPGSDSLRPGDRFSRSGSQSCGRLRDRDPRSRFIDCEQALRDSVFNACAVFCDAAAGPRKRCVGDAGVGITLRPNELMGDLDQLLSCGGGICERTGFNEFHHSVGMPS